MTPWTHRLQADAGKHLPSVAIVGGGISGLTTAYKLSQAGFKVTVYEAAQRLGGRIYTDHDAFKEQQQYCEKGGEWIDSTHHDIRKLAHELNLEIQDISKKRTGSDLFFFSGKCYSPSDFLQYSKEDNFTFGAFADLARYIGRDRRNARNNPFYEKELDQLSIDAYLTRAAAATKTPDWVIESIKVAYKGEFGADTHDQSALLLINQIGTGMKSPFEVYGPKQDESQRIKGGNAAIIEALREACIKQGVTMHTGHKLTRIDYRETNVQPGMYLEISHDGHSKVHRYDYAVCTLPFTKLREVEGLDELAERKLLSPEKLQSIRELGYGNIVKIMLGMHGRPWENNPRFPVAPNGSFRTDNRWLQNTWITSVGQKGEENSIITILVAGDEAKIPVASLVKNCKKGIAALFEKTEEEIFNHRHSFHIWPKNEFVKGSYSYMKPGQYTTLRLSAGTPEVHGRLGFAGEHTDPALYGYMSGAVASGIREAERIKAQLMEKPPATVETPPLRAMLG